MKKEANFQPLIVNNHHYLKGGVMPLILTYFYKNNILINNLIINNIWMEKRTLFLIVSIIVPTILWGILAYLVYYSIIDQNSFLIQLNIIDRFFSEPILTRMLVLLASYLIAISIGFIYYMEKRFWNVI